MTKIDEKMIECARALKEYCKGVGEDCAGCLFYRKDISCILCIHTPDNWRVEDLSKEKAVELLKKIRENISGFDGDGAINTVTALTMAIEALED